MLMLLLDPGIGQGLGEAGDGEIRRCGAIDDRRNDAGRQEGEGSQQPDVPFALGLARRAFLSTPMRARHSTLEDVVGQPFWETPWFTATPGMAETVRSGVAIDRLEKY
jgi:hypothetical protein